MIIDDVNWREVEHYYAKECCHQGGNVLCKCCPGCKEIENLETSLSDSGGESYRRWLTTQV